jgi:hypothetical protein
MYYGRADGDGPDVCVQWGGDGANRRDANLLFNVLASPRLQMCLGEQAERTGSSYKFAPSLIDELKARGYDVSTLKFSIEKKRAEPTAGPSHD